MLDKNIMRTKEYPLTPDFFAQDWVPEHRRWSCYLHYGVQCIVPGCNLRGTKVVHWYSPGEFKKYGDSGLGEHIDLIGYNDGTEFLMTVDHIIPKANGGPKIWWNLQPMCFAHNNKQRAKMLYRPNTERLLLIAEKSGLILPVGDSVVPDADLHDLILNHYKTRIDERK